MVSPSGAVSLPGQGRIMEAHDAPLQVSVGRDLRVVQLEHITRGAGTGVAVGRIRDSLVIHGEGAGLRAGNDGEVLLAIRADIGDRRGRRAVTETELPEHFA